jgi:hypothetical protein
MGVNRDVTDGGAWVVACVIAIEKLVWRSNVAPE